MVELTKIGTTAIAIGLTGLGLVGDRSTSVKRDLMCHYVKPLTEKAVKRYEPNGVKTRRGSFWTHVTPKGMPEISAIVFPEALSPQTWTKLPSSAIVYVGKGGDDSSWRDRLRPDYFYGLEVPPQATGLAFSRLCYRNGNVTIHSINTWTEDSQNKTLVVNNEIHLSDVTFPSHRSFQILVNAGSDRRDLLGVHTQVYFTTESLENPYQSEHQ